MQVKLQTKFAAMMNKLLLTIPAGKLKVIVVFFCLTAGGFSIYLFANAIVSKAKPSLRIERVNVPKHFDKAGDEITNSNVDSSLYQQIRDYKRYMDSTRQIIRPSLLDSIRLLEEIYLSQQTK